MKRKLFVLDAFTNGHDAALQFVQQSGWSESDCDIVFCGTHAAVFEKLTQDAPAYAVVPVCNSIAGEVTEVTHMLKQFRSMGYVFDERDQLDLQINHCLLVPSTLHEVTELNHVLSHEKAFQQCGTYLRSIGITPEQCEFAPSTGNAAKHVSRIGPADCVGAIASRAAAEAYGLTIWAENIQDVSENKTTFLLLQNEAIVLPTIVGIIGISGKFGQLLKTFFEHHGCFVIGSDPCQPDGFSNKDVVERASVVIFAVPMRETPSIVASMIPFVHANQLLMDVTSIKQPVVDLMMQTPAQVVGLHPMFRPEVSFTSQTVVVCPERLTSLEWKRWVVNVLTRMRANLTWSTPAEHDMYMTTVQVMPHVATLTNALLLADTSVSVEKSLAYTSPFYRIMFSLMGRLISQNPELYASIVMENPQTVNLLTARIAREQEMLEMIARKDYDAFTALFVHAREHFGEDMTIQGNMLFTRILSIFNTLYGTNAVVITFFASQNGPGLLHRLLDVFKKWNINLTGIHSVVLHACFEFTISFEQSRTSDSVRQALEEIEQWTDTAPVSIV